MTGFVKCACAASALFFPFAAGLILPFTTNGEVRFVVVATAVGIGLVALRGFARLER